jgi:hypothetical protein
MTTRLFLIFFINRNFFFNLWGFFWSFFWIFWGFFVLPEEILRYLTFKKWFLQIEKEESKRSFNLDTLLKYWWKFIISDMIYKLIVINRNWNYPNWSKKIFWLIEEKIIEIFQSRYTIEILMEVYHFRYDLQIDRNQ